MSPIFTARLRLRPLAGSDFKHILTLDCDPAVVHFTYGWSLWGGKKPRLENMTRRYKTRLLGRKGHFGFWVVENRTTGEWLGWVQLEKRPGAGVEVGYRFKRAAWGRGYATEAAGTVLREAYRRHGLAWVYARVVDEHQGSRRVLEKLGLTLKLGREMDCGPWAGALYYRGHRHALFKRSG